MFITDDTIVAVSSAAGPAGRAIVRLSGGEAVALAATVFEPLLEDVPGFRAVDGVAAIDGEHPVRAPCRA